MKRIYAILLCFVIFLTGCSNNEITFGNTPSIPSTSPSQPATQGSVPDLGDEDTSFGEDIQDTGAYEGDFSGESKDFEVRCLSGTKNAYKLEGTTLTFTALAEDTVYSISGTFSGNLIINTGDDHKFDLELHGFSLTCDSVNPITVLSGDEVAIKAKKDTKN